MAPLWEVIMSLSAMLFAAAIAASAPAQTDSDPPRATVQVADLDLSTSAGQARFRTRLASEIGWMCEVKGPVDAYMSRLRRDCIRTATRNAETAYASAVANARRRTELAAR
jgi:UrcA family protein